MGLGPWATLWATRRKTKKLKEYVSIKITKLKIRKEMIKRKNLS